MNFPQTSQSWIWQLGSNLIMMMMMMMMMTELKIAEMLSHMLDYQKNLVSVHITTKSHKLP